ncbi:MAG: hypothetical protein WDA27_15145 [Actinomycetota bacterium]
MRILDSETCRRVYSYLRLDRAPHKCDEGFGIGVLAPGWDPMSSPVGVQSGDSFIPTQVPGCQLWCETDTSRHLVGGVSQAVVFPADPLVNGNFETGGDPPAGWTEYQCTTTTVAGSRPGGTGAFVAHSVSTAASADTYQNALVVGNTYRITAWLRTDGNRPPRIYGGGATRWTGATNADWQFGDTGWFVATDAEAGFTMTPTAIGEWYEIDDVAVQCLNVSQLTDLTGLGHHLVQATAARQPLWVASGAGGLLRFIGKTRTERLDAADFTIAQPMHAFAICKWTADDATIRTVLDGKVSSTALLYALNANIGLYAGTATSPSIAKPANYNVVDALYAGASSAIAINGGAQTVGNPGNAAIDAITVGSTRMGGPYPFDGDLAALVIYNRALSEPERQRVVRYLRRLGARLGVSIP